MIPTVSEKNVRLTEGTLDTLATVYRDKVKKIFRKS